MRLMNKHKKKDRPVLFALEIACFRRGIDPCLTVLVRIDVFMCGLEFVLFCPRFHPIVCCA